jgi:exodeoxyribonuclease VII large subunit
MFASREFVADAAGRMRRGVGQQLGDKMSGLAQVSERLARMHPRRGLNDWMQRLDDLVTSLLRCAKQGAREHRVALRNLSERLLRVRPAHLLKQRGELLHRETRRLQEQARHRLSERQDDFGSLHARLRLLGPEQVLSRGYSITTDAGTGKVVRDAAEVASGQRLKTRLKAGEVLSRVEE